MNRVAVTFLYSVFSYASNILWLVLDALPQFVRHIFFLIAFKKFGRGCMVDYRCFFRYPWRVSIGNCVAINRGCEFYPSIRSANGYITLEDNVVLGPRVVIFSAGHDYSFLDLPDISAPVVICRHAWIGGNTTILPGVIIGEGAVVGAGSVVTKNIPAYSVAVGNPTKVIKNRSLNNRAQDQHGAGLK
jgi:acetyltransferase-like isoleucine patch superfamily enzyme